MKIHAMALSLGVMLGVSACGGSGSTLGNTSTPTGSTGNNTITRTVDTSSTSGTTSTSTSGVGLGSASSTSTSTSNSNTTSAVLNAEGLWRGSSDTSRTVTALIADNGFYWVLYSAAGNNATTAGVIVGNTISSNGSITSSNGKDFNFETNSLFPLIWTGSYTAKTRLQGTLTYTDIPGGIVTLNTTHDSGYNITPNVATISGRYTGSSTSLANRNVPTAFVIYATGQLTGSRTDGCTFSGNVTPRLRGNIYNVSITYGVGCSESNSGRSTSSTGTAYVNPANNQLQSVTLNNSVNDVLLFIGDKQ